MTEGSAALVAAEVFALVVEPAQAPALLVSSGEQGPAGISGGCFQHNQPSALATWVINHNLGYRPAVSLYTVGGMLMLANVQHIDTNQARAYFDGAVAGYAVCS